MKRKRIENFVIYLNQELGKGSFGKVYKGMNEITKQLVAVKTLPKKMSNSEFIAVDHDEYVKDAMLSEIKVMKKLKNDSIVAFIDILETTNNYYVIQQLCNGGDLKGAIRKFKRFAQPQAIDYLRQICEGFQDLINNSIVHRDVKPQNILIHNEKLKLADFGFAKSVVAHNTLQKSMVGTPLYMAPQILKRQKYSSKCDVWSVGIVFYEILFGCLPWTGVSEYELVNHIIKIPLSFPKTVEVSEVTKDFLGGCLQHDQQKRFGWQEVYQHSIFQNYFKTFTDKNKKLNEKAGYVINNLRLQIHSQNIDLEKLFNTLKYSKATSLRKPDFFALLKTLDTNISEEEAHYVFTKFDSDGSGSIEFQQFKNMLKQNEIRLNSIIIGSVQKKNTMIVEDDEDDEGGEVKKVEQAKQKEKQKNKIEQQQKIVQTLVKLRDKIEKHGLTLQAVYRSYDKNKDDTLDIQEFGKLLLKLDSTITEAEVEYCMTKFDSNGDRKISFNEFYKAMCKIAGELLPRKFSSSLL